MKRALFTAAGLVMLIAPPTLAADIGGPGAYGTPPVPYVYSWSGCYVGIHAGGGWQSSSIAEEEVLASGVGGLGGAQSGCNLQWRQFVIGVEGEFWASTLYDREYYAESGGGYSSTDDQRSRNPWAGAVSVRSGIAFDRILLYGKLGVAFGRFDYTENDSDSSPSTYTLSGHDLATGVLLGVGFEYALTDHWTAKLEYDYIDYGTTIVSLPELSCDPACAPYSNSEAMKESQQFIKLGVNYKFDWGATARPLAAKD